MEAMGAWEAALSALNTGTGILTLFESFDATLNVSAPHTAGRWTAVSYNAMSNTTTLTQDDGDPGDLIPSFAAGWRVQIDANLAYAFPVLAASGDSVTVPGDMTGLAAIDGVYALISPAGIDSSTGAVQTDPLAKESRYLFAGYRHLPAVAGFFVDPDGPGVLPLGVYGTQPGGNLAGDYHCGDRIYSTYQGRFTTPDTRPNPGSNLFSKTAKELFEKSVCCCVTNTSLAIDNDMFDKGNYWGHHIAVSIDMEWKLEPGGDCHVQWYEKHRWSNASEMAEDGYKQSSPFLNVFNSPNKQKTDAVKTWKRGRHKGQIESVSLEDWPAFWNDYGDRRRRVDFVIVITSGCAGCVDRTYVLRQELHRENGKNDPSKSSIREVTDPSTVSEILGTLIQEVFTTKE